MSSAGANSGQDGGAPGPKSPVRIGVIGTLSGPPGAGFVPQADGVRVWARWINDRGGVNGHPVEVLTGDDGGDPSRHEALVREFVEQKNVIAFVGDPELFTGSSSVDYLTKAGVAVIGSEMGNDYFYESPVYFPQGSHGPVFVDALIFVGSNEMKKRGFTKAGSITCVEAQTCQNIYSTIGPGFAKYGVDVVYQSQNSLAQPDFTAECLAAKRAGAQFLVVAMDATSLKNLTRSCARQNYHPTLVVFPSQTTPDMKDDPNFDGMLVVSGVGPWFSDGAPHVQEFVDAMNKYAPDTDPVGGHVVGWASAKVFELGAQQLPEPPTAQAIVDALQAIHGDPLPDLTGQLLYNRGAPATPSACAFTIILRNKSWTTDGQRPCV